MLIVCFLALAFRLFKIRLPLCKPALILFFHLITRRLEITPIAAIKRIEQFRSGNGAIGAVQKFVRKLRLGFFFTG